jgi:hypothetical protein
MSGGGIKSSESFSDQLFAKSENSKHFSFKRRKKRKNPVGWDKFVKMFF